MRLLTLALVVGLLANGWARSDEAATKIIKKAIESHGGEAALQKAKAGQTKMAGQMQLLGMELEFKGEVLYDVPGKFRLTMEVNVLGQKQSIVQIVNGDKLKQTSNGMPIKLGEAEKGEMMQAALMQEVTMLTPLLTEKFTVKAESPVESDGIKYDVITVSGKKFKDTKLFFDTKTGLMAKTERKAYTLTEAGPKEVLEVGLMSDYKKVDGILLPTKMQVLHDGKKFMTMTMTEGKLLEQVDLKQFSTED